MKKENIEKILDAILDEDEEALKKWIHENYPHGIGLYE